MSESLLSLFVLVSLMALSLLCGLGLMRTLRIRGHRLRLLLAPSLALASSAIFVSLACIYLIPIEQIAIYLWGFWLVMIVYGIWDVIVGRTLIVSLKVLIAPVLTTLIVLAGYIAYGVFDYLGSPALDGWSYISFGEYLLRFPRGTAGDLAPLYEYAAHLSQTRFTAAGLLAALIPPGSENIDTQMTAGPLMAIATFSYAAAVSYVAHVSDTAERRALNYSVVFIAVAGGWLPLAFNFNNFDNVIALSFSPALFAIGYRDSCCKRTQPLLPAMLIAGGVYGDPELSPLLVLPYFLIISQNTIFCRLNRFRIYVFPYLITAAFVLLFIAPYLADAFGYLLRQLASTSGSGSRPGEGFVPDLLELAGLWGSVWALGASWPARICGFFLVALLLLGIKSLWSRQQFAICLYLLLMLLFFAYMLLGKRYDYGAYKILLLGWWALSVAIAYGAGAAWRFTDGRKSYRSRLVRSGIVGTLIFAGIMWVGGHLNRIASYPIKSSAHLRDVQKLITTGNLRVEVAVDDAILNAWMVYFLKDLSVHFAAFRGYMDQPHVKPLMAGSKMLARSETDYLLTDAKTREPGSVVWQGRSLRLIESEPSERLPKLIIDAPNGQERLNGYPY